jgi:hypothetical protein
MPLETERRVSEIYKELNRTLGIPEGKTWIDED